MSIQAVGWAIEQQDVPSRAALVLIALANHADHSDGRCWPSIETIAREARCSRRAVFGYIAALERNGFVEVQRTRKRSGRQGTNNYWLVFNRSPAPWAHLPDHEEPEPPISPEDAEAVEGIEENSSTSGEAAGSEAQIQSANGALSEALPECKADAPGQSATVCTRHVMPEPSDSRTLEQVEGHGLKTAAPASYRLKPRTERAAASLAIEEEKPKPQFVYENSDAWKSWERHKGKRWTLVTTHIVEGKARRGWWFPSLYPPKTPPPALTPGDRTAPELSPEKTENFSALAEELEGIIQWQAGTSL